MKPRCVVAVVLDVWICFQLGVSVGHAFFSANQAGIVGHVSGRGGGACLFRRRQDFCGPCARPLFAENSHVVLVLSRRFKCVDYCKHLAGPTMVQYWPVAHQPRRGQMGAYRLAACRPGRREYANSANVDNPAASGVATVAIFTDVDGHHCAGIHCDSGPVLKLYACFYNQKRTINCDLDVDFTFRVSIHAPE